MTIIHFHDAHVTYTQVLPHNILTTTDKWKNLNRLQKHLNLDRYVRNFIIEKCTINSTHFEMLIHTQLFKYKIVGVSALRLMLTFESNKSD